MRFLIDADLPRSVKQLVQSHGHEGIDTRDIGLGDADDTVIGELARSEGYCLLTGDFGFADIRNYPPKDYGGLIIFELPKDATATTILSLLQMVLAAKDLLDKIPGRLAIVSVSRVRLRPQ